MKHLSIIIYIFFVKFVKFVNFTDDSAKHFTIKIDIRECMFILLIVSLDVKILLFALYNLHSGFVIIKCKSLM